MDSEKNKKRVAALDKPSSKELASSPSVSSTISFGTQNNSKAMQFTCKVSLDKQVDSKSLEDIANECHVSISIVDNNTVKITGAQNNVYVAFGCLESGGSNHDSDMDNGEATTSSFEGEARDSDSVSSTIHQKKRRMSPPEKVIQQMSSTEPSTYNLCLPVAAVTSSSSDGENDGSSSDMSIGYHSTTIHKDKDRRLLTNKEESDLKLILHGPAMISEDRVEEKVDRILQHVLSLARNQHTTPYIANEVRLVLLCFVHN